MCKWTQFFCFPFQAPCLLFSSLASLCVDHHSKDGITTMNRASRSSSLLSLYSHGTIRKGQPQPHRLPVWKGCGGVTLLRLCCWAAWATPLGLSAHLGCSWGEMRYWPNCWPLFHKAVGETVWAGKQAIVTGYPSNQCRVGHWVCWAPDSLKF